MTAFPLPGRRVKGALHWLIAALVSATFAAQAPAQEPIRVALDQATIMKLPERAATVVIGDPLIADLSIQPGGLAVVTGKGYGGTNVVVMDHSGAVLLEKTIVVEGPSDHVVFVYRGVARNTYSCTPECSPRITLGDDYEYFDKTLGQSASRNTQAVAAAAAATH